MDTEQNEKTASASIYISRVRIERVKGSLRRAYLPCEPAPVMFGTHDELMTHYGTNPVGHEPHAATFDYLVAVTAG